MKHAFTLFFLFLSIRLLAQNNYVVNTPNSSNPGEYNTLIGPYTGNNSMDGGANVFIGFQSGASNTAGGFNTFVGMYSGYHNTTGYQNTFLGGYCGTAITTGWNNAFIGFQTGAVNTTGSFNAFSGPFSGYSNTTGSNNTFMGFSAGNSNTTANSNTFIGYKAGYYNTTGNNNIIIGPQSGTAIITGDDNVLMGYNSQAEDGLKNAIAIGANSRVVVSNAMILGNQANVGIGTSAPTTRLHVRGELSNESGIRLEQLTSNSPTVRSSDQFLTVDQQGNVVKARYQLRINHPDEWSDKVFTPAYQLRSLPSIASYIEQNGHLPGMPSAEQVVKEGIDLVKMNATLLEKVEELTLYSIQQEKTNQQLQAEVNELKQMVKQLLEKK